MRNKESSCENEEMVFFNLAPNENIEDGNDAAYAALIYSLNEKNTKVHNIAISGPFGAGKSSLWRSFKNKFLRDEHTEDGLPCPKEILDISLAKFAEENKVEKNISESNNVAININNSNLKCSNEGKLEQSKNVIENNTNPENDDEEKMEYQIEKSILQQMLFSVKQEDIPCLESYKYSREKKRNYVIAFILAALFFIGICFVCKPEMFTWYMIAYVDNERIIINIYLIFIALMFVLSIILGTYLYKFIVKASNLHVCNFGLSFKGLDVSFEQSNGSLINQNYSAIVYFFEKTKKKIVAFEDLDRFPSNKIFVKLRELNSILNSCPSVKEEIKFVYMVKENLFTKYERTKFFDIIIPVLPVISMESSADFLLDKKNNGMDKDDIYTECPFEGFRLPCAKVYPLKKVSDELLRIVGNYINDFRVIKDCINEYLIYKTQLEKDLNSIKNEFKEKNAFDDKIFAMIVYKNYYPQDFEDLHRHKGYLYDICKNYKHGEIYEDESEKINGKIVYNNTLIEACLNKEEGNGRWINRQCLKLEHKIKYESDGCTKADVLRKAEENGQPSLLFDLLKTGYIDINCEFYISRKYLGNWQIEDYRYFVIILSNDNPVFELEIQSPHLLENRILMHQWLSPSTLNFRMFAYQLSKPGAPKENSIITNMVRAVESAERKKMGFVIQFVTFLREKIQNHKIVVENEKYVVSSEEASYDLIKRLWSVIDENMVEGTLASIFGEE